MMKHRVSVRRSRAGLAAATLLAAAIGFSQSSAAQDELESQTKFKDWSVFVDNTAPQKYCYAATVPKDFTSSREGIRRGQAYLMIASYPSDGIRNELSVTLGFNVDPNKEIKLTIGETSFDLYADGEVLWLESSDRDDELVAAMRRGATAEVTSTSMRGTRITDVYSLIGFTDSVNRANQLCS